MFETWNRVSAVVAEDLLSVREKRFRLEAKREASSSSLDSIPVEVLEHILLYLPSTKDILKFALTSKANYNISLPLLYNNVDWVVTSESSGRNNTALHSIEFLRTHPELYGALRSLRISEKRLPANSNTTLVLDSSRGDIPLFPGRHPLASNFKETHRVTSEVTKLLPHFSGLTELTLRFLTLPRNFYETVHALSDMHLRRLIVRNCRLTTRYPRGYNPLDLQLTELTIFSIYPRTPSYSGLPKLRALLKLAWCPTLRVLRMDRSVDTAIGSLIAHGLPPSIRSLELDWRFLTSIREGYGNLFYFLNNCRHVQHLELTDMGKLHGIEHLSSEKRLSPHSLPSLTSVKMPYYYLGLFIRGRPIDSIVITDSISREVSSTGPMLRFLKLEEISSILHALQASGIQLHSLKFNMRRWDKELFYMLSIKQGMLRELSIGYQIGDIGDDFFMTVGNQIEFPHLEKLHLYRFGDLMKANIDERFIDHKEYMIIWQMYMPNLREVALTSNTIWRRTEIPNPQVSQKRKTRSIWAQYSVEPMEGVEGLLMLPCPKDAKAYESFVRQRRSFPPIRLFPPHYWPPVQNPMEPIPFPPQFDDPEFENLVPFQQDFHP